MREKLRSKIEAMLMSMDTVGQLSQFTLDWIEQNICHGEDGEIRKGDSDGSLHYDIETVLDVLRFGKDKDFFQMLKTYADFYCGHNRK